MVGDTCIAPTLVRVISDDWQAAISLWLERCNSPETRRAYARALEDLLIVSGAMPWEITRTDVLRWVEDMRKRGLKAATIALRASGASSFFRFCQEDYLVRGQPLHPSNPAAGRAVRPRVSLYGRSAWLSVEEAKRLLAVIGREDVRAKRNYALILGYLLLARRNSEWRTARFGDIETRDGKKFYRWHGKGKVDQLLELPAPVWSAVADYLEEAGRLESVRPEDHLFTALNDVRLPGGQRIPQNQPISAHEVGRLLKRYCRLAGLDAATIHPHSLRHTGAMLRKKAGADLEEIMQFLGHSSLAVTQVYLHSLEGRSDQSWQKVAALLGLVEHSSGNRSYQTRGAKCPI